MTTSKDCIAAERAHRLAKLERLRERGIAPYPVTFPRDHSVGEVRGRFAGLDPGSVTDTEVRVAGRLMRLFEEDADLSLSQRLLRRLATILNPFFQIKSLREFNEKFDPEWSPRSIVMEAAEEMPRVGILFATVEGFLTVPVIGSRLVPSLRAGAADEQPAMH